MTAVYMDGFETYGTGVSGNQALLQSQWTQIQSNNQLGVLGTPSWGSRTGSISMTCITTSGQTNNVTLPSGLSNLFLSLGFSFSSVPTSNFQSNICKFYSSNNTVIAALWCQTDGSIVLADINNNVLATSSSGLVSETSTWYFFEINFNQAGSTFTLRINDAFATDTPAIQGTSLNLGNSEVAKIGFLGCTRSQIDWIDDLFIRNTLGSYNYSWIGETSISTISTENTYISNSKLILNNPPVTATLANALQIGYVSFTENLQSQFTTFEGNSELADNTSVNNTYFNDIYEIDPNTTVALSPVSIANGYITIFPTSGVNNNITNVTVLLAYQTGISNTTALPAWTFVIDGHRFYVLSLGQQGDWAYDFTTKEWCQLQSQGFPGLSFAHGVMWDLDIVVADILYPYIYTFDPTQPLDEEWREVEHMVTGGIPTRGRSAIGVANFTLTASVGLDSEKNQPLSLSFSDDNGVTYSQEFNECLTDVSTQSLIWNALGSFAAPGRIFKITDFSGPIRIDGADVVLTIGSGADSGQDQEGQQKR